MVPIPLPRPIAHPSSTSVFSNPRRTHRYIVLFSDLALLLDFSPEDLAREPRVADVLTAHPVTAARVGTH
jgi:hypothetical protein